MKQSSSNKEYSQQERHAPTFEAMLKRSYSGSTDTEQAVVCYLQDARRCSLQHLLVGILESCVEEAYPLDGFLYALELAINEVYGSDTEDGQIAMQGVATAAEALEARRKQATARQTRDSEHSKEAK